MRNQRTSPREAFFEGGPYGKLRESLTLPRRAGLGRRSDSPFITSTLLNLTKIHAMLRPVLSRHPQYVTQSALNLLKIILAFSITFSILAELAGCNLLFPSYQSTGSIIGTWQFTLPSNPDSFTMTLTTGLTFTETYNFGSTANTYSGTYTSDSSSIIFTTTVFNGVPGAAQVANADYSLSPNGKSLVLNYQSGTPAGAPTVLFLAKI